MEPLFGLMAAPRQGGRHRGAAGGEPASHAVTVAVRRRGLRALLSQSLGGCFGELWAEGHSGGGGPPHESSLEVRVSVSSLPNPRPHSVPGTERARRGVLAEPDLDSSPSSHSRLAESPGSRASVSSTGKGRIREIPGGLRGLSISPRAQVRKGCEQGHCWRRLGGESRSSCATPRAGWTGGLSWSRVCSTPADSLCGPCPVRVLRSPWVRGTESCGWEPV